jgi:hypothetical protein
LKDDDPPPILGSWRNLYLLVVAGWAAAIALCAWIARFNG